MNDRKKGELIGKIEIIQEDDTDYWVSALCSEYMEIRTSFQYISNDNIKFSIINELINEYKNKNALLG